MRLWQLATRQWGLPQKKHYHKTWMLGVKSCGQAHHPTNLLSEECGNANDLFKELLIRLAPRSAPTPPWHLGCFSAESNICYSIHLSYMYILVWWHPAMCNMLQSVSKLSINAFDGMDAVMGRALAVRSQCHSFCWQTIRHKFQVPCWWKAQTNVCIHAYLNT